MENKKVFSFDVDGVLLDFYNTWLDFSEKILQRRINTIDKNAYNLIERLDISKTELFKTLACFSNDGQWEKIFIIEDSLRTIREILKNGHYVHFITGIPEEVAPYREKQLIKLFPVEYNKQVFLHIAKNNFVIFSKNKTKYEHIKNISPALYVDDLHFHCGEAFEAGVKNVFLMESVHNGGDKTIYSNNFKKIKNLNEIL